ncbi:MAG: crotonase/enoyl-CoA hydratase family protein [Actinomycetota bacterium]
MQVETEKSGKVFTVIINRPEVKNAIDYETSRQLGDAFRAFEADGEACAAVLWGAHGTFCAGADLKALAADPMQEALRLNEDMTKDGPLGPTRMLLSKPVIAAISGYCVAGGLELAVWCDLRVAEEDAVLGIFERRFGVPLIDGGTQRLPRLIGMSRALDMILTGRPVGAREALEMGLVNRVVGKGEAREAAEELAAQLAEFPQTCMRNDREALYRGIGMTFDAGLEMEYRLGIKTLQSGESVSGAGRFTEGEGKHGKF